MKISCNALKKYIKNSEDIDFNHIWDKFTIRTAEVEGIEIKGQDTKEVYVAEIVECSNHPTKEKYHILKVNTGSEIVDILCGAPNARKGLKTAIVKVGGSVCGITIEPKKIAGVLSNGMLCSKEELGFGENCTGIIEFPDNYEVGKNVKEYLPLEDIIVEIDNKSLTNRPDLWGHYGIAREIAAITDHEMLPLETIEIPNNKTDLKIKINNKELCSRYTGLKIGNITKTEAPFDMQIFLEYTGMRSINLLVDLTNYLMLELGQPMHAFDASKIKSIEVDNAKDNDEYITLDGQKRILKDEFLMIKNNGVYAAVAGVMGGLDSEIKDNTKEIILESATFDAASVRKTATKLGLRTEASARYEKSLDPNMTIIATKRFAKLLKDTDESITFESNVTDIYPKELKEIEVTLSKEKLYKYVSEDITDEQVINILSKLEFSVKNTKNAFKVIVPTFRATKDVTMDVDIIEEISRMYGYENIHLKPLKQELAFKKHETIYENEYNIKRYLATKFNLNEVNSYLWYKTSLLNKLNIEKDNIRLAGKSEDNILRDDLCLSLLEITKENLKNYSKVNIFEIGTVILNNENNRHLGIIVADSEKNTEKNFYEVKNMINDLLITFKHQKVTFKPAKHDIYYNEKLGLDIIVGNQKIGEINVLKHEYSKVLSKKKEYIMAKVSLEEYNKLTKVGYLYNEISKFPEVYLDYSIILSKNDKYSKLEDIINRFNDPIIKSYELRDIYEDETNKTYTIRYTVGSYEKTLSPEDLMQFKTKFINYIKENQLKIVE